MEVNIMDKRYVVDLSQRLVPGKEHNFKFDIDLKDAMESLPDFTHDEGVWYKIAYINMCTHNGTHVEVPFHHIKEGYYVADFPLDRVIGNLVLLDFSNKPKDGIITLEDLKKHDTEIKAGDFVFMKTHMDKYFRSADWNTYPYVELSGVEWLIEKKIAVLGTDAAGIENPTAHNQPGHVTLFKANIPLVESLTNLDAIENGKYLAIILPLPIEQGDASPVRVIAVSKEGMTKFLGL
jgi:arylformamidase